jgi:hypothetical protein
MEEHPAKDGAREFVRQACPFLGKSGPGFLRGERQ